MSILKLSAPNPLDGTTTFDQIVFVYADDTAGTNKTDITTVSISTTNRTDLNPGVTSYTYTSATLTKYFAAEYKNSTSGTRTTAQTTDYILGSLDRWDTMFMNELSDTSSAVWSAVDRSRYKQWALDALYPELFDKVIDTSLTIDAVSGSETYSYTLPFGIFNVFEVGVGDIDNITTRYKVVHSDNWHIDAGKLILESLASFDTGEAIRLVAAKKFLEVGATPERYDEIAMCHMKMSAYLNMADDFPRFLEWGRMQGGTKVSFENLRVHAREYENKFQRLKLQYAESLKDTIA